MANDNRYGFDTKALHKWWRDLDEHRGRRARLRRCHTLKEVMETHAFKHSARFRLREAGLRGSDEQRAAVAGLLAHIREHAPEHSSFAAQMATPGSAGGRPPVSEMRFRRLLRKKSRSKLYKPLRRVLPILGTPPRANIFEIAQDALLWGGVKRREWAEEYYAVLFREDEPPRETDDLKTTWQAWWEELQQPERRGERAALRRCSTLDAVMLTTGYHRLLHYLRKAGVYQEQNKRQHAAVAGLLAHVEEEGRHPFPAQMALSDRAADALAEVDAAERSSELTEDEAEEKRRKVRGEIQDGKFGSAPLSGLRFRRLVQVRGREALFRRLIRTLRLLGGTAKVEDVASAAFYWGGKKDSKTRRRWSLDYYTHAPSDEP